MQIQAAAPPRAPIPAATPPSTLPPPAAAPLPEPLPTKLERLHAEALDALRLVMTRALDSITTLPPPAESDADTDEPAQSPADHARTVTQRMRLALTAARDLLRYTANADTQTPPADDRRSPQPTRPWRKPGQEVAQPTRPWRKPGQEEAPPTRPWRKPGLDVAGTPESQTTQARAIASSHTDTTQAASTLLAAARPVLSGAERTKAGSDVPTRSVSPTSRFDERIDLPHDSELSTHDSTSPRDSSLVAHTSPPSPRRERDTRFTRMTGESLHAYRLRRGTPYIPPPPSTDNEAPPDPNKPAPLTEHECYRFRAAYFDSKPISVEVYNRMLEWHRYAQASGTPHPISITLEHLRKIKPPDLPDPGP